MGTEECFYEGAPSDLSTLFCLRLVQKVLKPGIHPIVTELEVEGNSDEMRVNGGFLVCILNLTILITIMDQIDKLVRALRKAFDRRYDWRDYIDANVPFGTGRGAEIWLEYEQGTTEN